MSNIKLKRFILLSLVLSLILLSGCITIEIPYVNQSGQASSGIAVVEDVVDGDTINVRYQETGEEETIRIYGIDTPEKSTRATGTGEFGVRPTQEGRECLEDSAAGATQFGEKKLEGQQVRVVNTSGPNRGDFGRQLRYVIPENSNRTYGSMILDRGLARVYDDKGNFDNYTQYTTKEKSAKTSLNGLWSCSVHNGKLAIFEVRDDAMGSDIENPTEFIEIGNTGSEPVNLNSYTLQDKSGKTYSADGITIGSGETIQIHTCQSPEYIMNSSVWNHCSGIWNNGGDSVVVRNNSRTVLELRYE